MSRDVGARVVAAGDDRRGDEGHAPVLGLKLHGVHVGPDGHHGLAREAAANLGEPEVKRQTAAEDTARQGPGGGGDSLEVPVGGRRVDTRVEERLDHADEHVGNLVTTDLAELGILVELEDRVDETGLTVEDRLTVSSWLA